jgi:hypothetical protein
VCVERLSRGAQPWPLVLAAASTRSPCAFFPNSPRRQRIRFDALHKAVTRKASDRITRVALSRVASGLRRPATSRGEQVSRGDEGATAFLEEHPELTDRPETDKPSWQRNLVRVSTHSGNAERKANTSERLDVHLATLVLVVHDRWLPLTHLAVPSKSGAGCVCPRESRSFSGNVPFFLEGARLHRFRAGRHAIMAGEEPKTTYGIVRVGFSFKASLAIPVVSSPEYFGHPFKRTSPLVGAIVTAVTLLRPEPE